MRTACRRILAAAGLAMLLATPPAWGAAWNGGPPDEPGATAGADGEPGYLRVRDEDGGARLRLEVAIRTMEPSSGPGPTVHLVGVVHIGDRSYYESLQRFLDAQEVVLYEGVKPGGGEVPEGADADDAARIKVTKSRQRLLATLAARHWAEHGETPGTIDELLGTVSATTARLGAGAVKDGWGRPQSYTLRASDKGRPRIDIVSLGEDGVEGGEGAAADLRFSDQKPLTKAEKTGGEGIQVKLARALGLEFQLASIDYDRAGWRNSDLSVDEVQANMLEAGLDGSALFGLVSGQSLSARLVGLILGVVEANPTMAMMTKAMLLETMAQSEAVMANAPGGMGAFMRVLIEDRNDAVLVDLRRILEAEARPRSVALFYGAGHLPHLEERLIQDFGYVLKDVSWETAIDLDLSTVPGGVAQAAQMRKMIRQSLAARAPKPPSAASDVSDEGAAEPDGERTDKKPDER